MRRKFKEMSDIAKEKFLHLLHLIVRQISSEFTSIKTRNKSRRDTENCLILVTGNTLRHMN